MKRRKDTPWLLTQNAIWAGGAGVVVVLGGVAAVLKQFL
jgi:hypothetical protein